MMSTPFERLACPIDGRRLTQEGSSWRCEHGHGFDIARQGYVNLLPVQNKRSADPGDSKPMVAARQRFLAAGHYAPIAAAVSRLVMALNPVEGPLTCLDAGCGEGYYLRELAAQAPAGQALSLLGLDISKWAVMAAAKQDSGDTMAWVVGSNANLPVQPASVDVVLCMFGFPMMAEFERVLKPGGTLIKVEAGPDHLRELREVIYPTLKPDRPPRDEVPHGFVHHALDTVRFTCEIDTAQGIADLLAMTPHLYRASAEGRARAAALEALSVTVDVSLVQYRRQER
ncbi:putative RNA methyltransferase [Larsenimonas rhizosphaerae]|uniref:Methyltransferase domain-containing protein n=1 Tax=Larsenimonas rhizosphaerae TaxID=2944682 RepID=A0AA42CSP2_9GAMM|nr:methyltransferase domain-containing protein [Larsenimonas rhizosphaerae]MCX2522757.1 methyltransferase domain-containing protein [Larsenimonas rhizosphaerae]